MYKPVGICYRGCFIKVNDNALLPRTLQELTKYMYYDNWDTKLPKFPILKFSPILGIIENKKSYSVFIYSRLGYRELHTTEIHRSVEAAIMRGIERSLEDKV